MDKRNAVISALFEKKNKRKPKNSQELQDFIQSQGGDEFLKKVDEYIDQAEKEQTKQAQKAEHGTKLQYLKSLKNKCNEDEELVYYKKGGTVDCGCVKKKGGEINKAKSDNPIERFKAKKASLGTTLNDKTPNKTKEEQAKIEQKKIPVRKFKPMTPTHEAGGRAMPKGPYVKGKVVHAAGMGCHLNKSKIKVSCGGSTLKK